jgi:hypothetical protein
MHVRSRIPEHPLRSHASDSFGISRRRSLRGVSVPSGTLGALAVGAIAVGALAIGMIAIGRLAIGRARIGRLEIDELAVRRFRVTEEFRPPVKTDPES